MIKTILGLVLFASLGVLLIAFFMIWFFYAVEKGEELECKKWEQQAIDYEGFFYTDWQKEQCNIK